MSKVYKYASVATGMKILEGNMLVVTNPLEFNDVNDSELFVSSKDLKKGIKTYISFINETEIYNAVKELYSKGHFDNKRFQRLTIKIFLARIGRRREKGLKRGYYSPRITIDRLRMLVNLASFSLNDNQRKEAEICFDELDKFSNDIGYVKMKDLIESLPTNIRVSCFSLRPDISKMWSHYADKHNGVCIEYDNSIDTVPVNYVKNNHYVKFDRLVRGLLSNLLVGKNVDFQQDDLIKLLPLLNKSQDWKEEMEERMVVSSKDSRITRIKVDDKELELYPVPSPTKVIIGIRVNELDRVRIIKICDERNIPVEFCQKGKKYKVHISPEPIK